ncbi:hypothetical protein WSM22_18240 [Cytophagales bacterium WSM2-2]|nr:hypothetical protein WSM22_18240 [Cytophagales bacterium WSM2-2]
MKYVIIPYIALGLILSLAIGIKYNCAGQEMFPVYYGSPFVFKQKSLGSSMEYFYSISGLTINILVWSFVFFLINQAIQRLIPKLSKAKLIRTSYNIVIGLMIAFTTLNIVIDASMVGRGFDKGLNYWYWDTDKEAKDWGMTCEGEVTVFGK